MAKPFLTAQGSFCSCLALQFNKSAKMFVPKPPKCRGCSKHIRNASFRPQFFRKFLPGVPPKFPSWSRKFGFRIFSSRFPEENLPRNALQPRTGFHHTDPMAGPFSPYWAILAASIQKNIFKTNLSTHPGKNILTYITTTLFLFQARLTLTRSRDWIRLD